MKSCLCGAIVILAGLVSFAAGGQEAGGAGTSRFEPRVDAAPGKNLVRNGSFECGDDLWSSLGASTGWGGDLSGLYGRVDSADAWDGRSSLVVELGPGKTPETCFDVWPPALVVQHAPLAAQVGWMAVPEGKPLTLSAYLRSSVPGTKARFHFRFAGDALGAVREAASEVVVTQEWKRYAVTQTALAEDVCIAIGPDTSETPDTAVSFRIDAVQLEVGDRTTDYEPREPVEVGLTTGRYGNVFEAGQPVVLAVYGDNRSAEDTVVPLRLEWEDYFGAAVEPEKLALRIPAGTSVRENWTLRVPGKGLYRARVAWTSGGREHTRALKLAVIEPYPHTDSPFGLNHPATTTRQLELMSRAGLRWVRNWSVNWGWIEPSQGQVSWEASDAQFRFMAPTGLNNLIVFPNPSTNWASSAPAEVSGEMWHRMAYAPREPRLLFEFVEAAVRRYKHTCSSWEFLNEPLWVPDFCLPAKGGYKVADYVALLEGASKAIRAADPGGRIIAGLSIDPKSPLGDEFIAAGGLGLCDALNLHPYGGRTLPEEFVADMARIQQAMDAQGGRKPIWATETGYYAVDDKPWQPWVVPKNHFSAELLLESERMAADYTVRHALILMAYGVEKFFYHEPLDGPINIGTMDIEHPFLAEDGVPKKTFVALSALANLLGPSPRFERELSFPEAYRKPETPLFGYAFQCGPTAVAAAWAPGNTIPLTELTLEDDVAVFDVVGNPVRGPLVLGESPVYLVSRSRTARDLSEHWYRP